MKNLLNNNLLFQLTIVLIVVGCRKDPHPIEEPPPSNSGCVEDWCDEFPTTPEIGFNYTSEGLQYLVPCFNPNNSNEFVYIRRGQSVNPELVKYDVVTNQETVLLDPMSLGRPDWGRQGWITFVYTFQHIWKIFDDGSQLTQLTSGEDDKFPKFNYAGDKTIYMRNKWYSNFELTANPDLYKNFKMLIIDLNGNVIDSILVPNIHNPYQTQFTYQTWQESATDLDNNWYFMEGTNNLQGLYMLQEDTIVKIKEWYTPQDFMDIEIYGECLYYTGFRKGIFKIDLVSGIETQLKAGCDTRYYRSLSVSSDGKKMLVQKVISTPYDNDQAIDEQNEIWLLDLDGCGEIQILGE